MFQCADGFLRFSIGHLLRLLSREISSMKKKIRCKDMESRMSFSDLRLRREDVASLAPGGSQ